MTKAHRRVKVHPKDWGAMACKISSASQTVWLNKTGTFGVASAAFWWSHLMGLFGRLAWGAMLDDWFSPWCLRMTFIWRQVEAIVGLHCGDSLR